MDELLAKVERPYIKEQTTDARPGDTVQVQWRVTEGSDDDRRTRLQTFEGVVIARHGGGVNESIMVRRVSYGIGVERVFPLHSPMTESIDVVRHGAVRRAKLYYLRQRRGRKARVKEKARVRPQVAAEAKAAAGLRAAEQDEPT